MPGAKRLEELIIWTLACELRDGICAALSQGESALDRDFRWQIESSCRSVASNIAEGYGHFRPRPFANYLRIARASAMETRSHITEGRTKYFSPVQADRFFRLAIRIIAGTSSLIRYLDSCDPNLDLRPHSPRKGGPTSESQPPEPPNP